MRRAAAEFFVKVKNSSPPPTVGRLLTDRLPTVGGGELFFTFTAFLVLLMTLSPQPPRLGLEEHAWLRTKALGLTRRKTFVKRLLSQ